MVDKFINIEFDAGKITNALSRLQDATGNLTPAFREIKEVLIDSTKNRFKTSTAPDGSQWAPNSQTTYEMLLERKSGDYQDGKRIGTKKGYIRKDGRVSARSATMLSGKQPLIDEGSLMEQIEGRIEGQTLEIYSNREYAAMQQFGGTRAEFPHLWGDIPARPFLGVSAADEAEILTIVNQHIEKALK